jgi:hypothetical protein
MLSSFAILKAVQKAQTEVWKDVTIGQNPVLRAKYLIQLVIFFDIS